MYKTNCIRCTLALNVNIKRYKMTHGKYITLEQIGNFSMAHTGVCYRNSKLAPASAEETQSAMMAPDLLVDGKGNYAVDDRAILLRLSHLTMIPELHIVLFANRIYSLEHQPTISLSTCLAKVMS